MSLHDVVSEALFMGFFFCWLVWPAFKRTMCHHLAACRGFATSVPVPNPPVTKCDRM